MGKSFSSFRKLVNDSLALEQVLNNYRQYHAHTHSKKEPEKLHEHTAKVLEYFLKLADSHDMDRVINSLIEDIIHSARAVTHRNEFGNYLKRLFVDSILFHDFGKINENFQTERMNNGHFQANPENPIGSYHSKLSAYLFLNYHFSAIYKSENLDLNDEEKALLYAFVYLFANPILKHHSSFLNHFVDFTEKEIFGLKPYLDRLAIDISEELQAGFFEGYEKIFKEFNKILNDKNCFPIYALLKLNFSLLTSADFYATFAFRNDIEIDDFGLLNEDLKEKFTNKFQSLQSYNEEIYKRFDEYLNLPFDDLQERNQYNLNRLRQKLSAEVISNIREHSSQNLFYLEAPTGSGKTNLSLASVIELLERNEELDKVFYVFPFTTLVDQTSDAIKETIGATNKELIQLHSKSGFHSQKEENKDGLYGSDQLNYIDNLFLNYPITLLTHIKFFDILKGNGKETNYLLHRLSNSIVIIDELQTYDPKHWDKVIFFLSHYARHFNIRFILMSATLPKIDELSEEAKGETVSLVDNKSMYFRNPNFCDRISFDFSLLDKNWSNDEYLDQLSEFIFEKGEYFAQKQNGKIRILVECITKKTASKLRKKFESKKFSSYTTYLISGEILEPRRKTIIDKIDQGEDDKVMVVSTQVIEAGVDIDMDLGFKDRSLIDSDEQLAGRVNRNAKKENCKVYLFNYDSSSIVYKGDKRHEITKKEITKEVYEEILNTKDFDRLYGKVSESIIKRNEDPLFENLTDYKNNFRRLNFSQIDSNFQLIEDSSNSVFIPLNVPIDYFGEEEKNFLRSCGLNTKKETVSGSEVFELYKQILTNENLDYINKRIDLKRIYGIMSRFMISVFKTQEYIFAPYIDEDILEKFGIFYLRHWKEIYDYENGIKIDRVEAGAVFI